MYKALVTLYNEYDEVIASEYAYGNTRRTLDAAAGACRRQLENEHEASHPGCNGVISATERA